MSDTTGVHQASAEQDHSGQNALFQNMPLPAWVYDAETCQFLDVNAAAVESYGYSREEFLSMRITDICLQEDMPRLLENLKQHTALRHLDGWQCRRKDGSLVDVEFYSRALTYNGRRAALMTALDVTERRLAEEVIREREEQYRAIFNGVQDAILVEALDGRILAVNDRACEMFGYNREEFLTKTVADLVPPHEPVLLASGPKASSMLETYSLRANGERFPVEMSGRVQTLGGREILLIILRDVTERKNAEAFLRASEEKLQNIIRHSSSLFYTHTPDHVLVYVSPQSREILDCEPEDAMIRWQEFLSDHPLNALGIEFTQRAIETGERQPPYELELVTRKGRKIWVQVDESPIVRDGKTVAITGSLTDITQRKQAEEQVRRRVAELEALYQSGISFTQTFNSKEIGEKIIEIMAGRLDWHHAAVRIRRGNSDEIELLAYSQTDDLQDPARLRTTVTRVGQGLAGWVIEHGLHLRVSNLEDDPRYVETYTGMKSGLYVPIRIFDQTIGCINVESEKENAFTEEDERLLSTIAVQAAVALDNARLFEELQSELSERIKFEKALAENEEKYRSLVDQIPVVVYLDDARTELPVTRFVSPRIQELLGYSPEEWMAGDFDIWVQSIHPEDRERVINHYLACMQQGALFAEEYRMFTRDGRIVWVRDSASVQTDESGKPLRMQGIIQDVTEIKEAEAVMRLQSAALESTDNAIVITDRSGTILWINSAYTRLTGYTLEEAVGKTPRLLYSGVQDQAFYRQLWDTILSGRVWRGELINKRKDGSLYHEEQTITPLLDSQGQVTHFIGVKQDITSRKQAQAKLDQHIERLAALREIDQAITSNFDMRVSLNFLLSRLLKLLSVDAADILLLDAAAGILKFEAGHGFILKPEKETVRLTESYAGQAVREMRLIAIPDLTRLRSHLFQTGFLKGENFVSYYGMPLIVKGKVVGVLEIFNRSILWPNDEWFGTLEALAGQAAIAVDNAHLFASYQRELAERKSAEEKLRESHAELEKRIEARTADLRRANYKLERALRVKDEFLANMSHELRTPLNAVIGLSDSLAEQTAGPLSDKQQKYIATIRESGQHLLELINDILDLAKIEAGQIALSREKVDVTAVCQSCLRMVKQLAQKKNHQVFFDMDAGIGAIWADERRLKQMLVNLLGNAVKFTPENGKIGLQVRGDRENNILTFAVWDTGIGIREEDLPRLFKPFTQLDSDLARKAGGTGLGLALVAKLAAMHGGSVGVESQPGTGSRFTISLPWESALVTGPLPEWKTGKVAPGKPDSNNQNYTILLVEDTDEVVMLIRDYLEHAGYRVRVAPNGVEAVAQAAAIQPSLILMDVQMPVMDGLEATRRIRKISSLQHTPIIALTALAMKGDRERCLEAGMSDYISKPVELKTLNQIIQSHLSAEKRDPA
ncbi:MAG: PAS domain S-box protein [Chloroflexi bacterium]|nr:PAS domain S-box protein [Chloroflexota bacterium]